MLKKYYRKETLEKDSNEKIFHFHHFLMIQVIFFLILAFFFMKNELKQRQLARNYPVAVIEPTQASEVKGVMAEENDMNNSVEPEQNIIPTLANLISPTPTVYKLKKDSYTIAIIGDSMVDTMGERLEYLEHSLVKKYPKTSFTLYNYGKGMETVEDGLKRLYKLFSYQDRHYSPLTETKPDIIIIGSFAYNPFFPYDRDRHWLTLTALVQEIQKINSQVYMLAEIAPLRRDFGKGPNGVNWDEDTAYTHSGRIIEQLENAVGLARTLNVHLINVYQESLESEKKAGKKEYVNPSDGIHPSVKGHEFTADIISKTILLD